MARARFHALPVWVQQVWKNRKLSWGFEFLERTRILSGIQFTKHFVDFIVVETKKFVGSIVNVILTRQTCGQHSSMSAGSKRRALGKYVSVQICYVLLMSKCWGDSDLGLCTFWYLRMQNRCAAATSDNKHVWQQKKSKFAIAQRFSIRKYPKSALDLIRTEK